MGCHRHRVLFMLVHQIVGNHKMSKECHQSGGSQIRTQNFHWGGGLRKWTSVLCPSCLTSPNERIILTAAISYVTRRFSRFFAQESTMHTFVWWWHGCCHWCGWFLGVLFDLCYLSRHIVAPWHIMACSHVVRPWLTTKKKRLNRNKIGS